MVSHRHPASGIAQHPGCLRHTLAILRRLRIRHLPHNAPHGDDVAREFQRIQEQHPGGQPPRTALVLAVRGLLDAALGRHGDVLPILGGEAVRPDGVGVGKKEGEGEHLDAADHAGDAGLGVGVGEGVGFVEDFQGVEDEEENLGGLDGRDGIRRIVESAPIQRSRGGWGP